MIQRLEPAPGVLYVVGTPIGHLGDLSPRAKSILMKVTAIACEDTRHSSKLLKSIGSNSPLFSFHKHNIQSRLPRILDHLEKGQSIALISDAGLPGISDPGELLVAASRKAGHEVICIPGPCAATTALVSSGLPCNTFCFEGFLPNSGNTRKQKIAEISKEPRTTIIYEAPHKLLKLLGDLEEACGADRPLQVARELTKIHEEQIGPTISSAIHHFQKKKPIGECTLILGGAPPPPPSNPPTEELIKELRTLIQTGLSASDATRQLAASSGQSKRMLYSLLHKEKLDKAN